MLSLSCSCENTGNLNDLFYCEKCAKLTCILCSVAEIQAYFCPVCLFDVPSASVKSDLASCPRNCLACPVCSSTCSLNASNQLNCPTCRWIFHKKFERPTGLSSQLAAMYESRIEVDEYNALKDYYSELNRFYSSTNTRKQRVSIPSALLSAMPSLGSINNSFSSKRSSSIYSNGPDFPEFISTAAFSAPDPETEVKPEYKTTSTLSQMFNQLYSQHQLIKNLAPLRIKLRTRVSRKCRECDTCILKPDSKTKSIDFIVNCAARNYFPDISIIDPLPVFKPDTHSILVLSFRFLESVDVSLQVEDCSGCLVDLLVKKFKIANNEFVNEPVEGIFEARNKYTSILVDVKPIFIDGSARIKFTLAVTCSKTKSIGNFVIDMGEISST